jgi:transposase-like protein
MNILVEKAVWQPSDYKCTCPHCNASVYSKTPKKNYVCTECNKEFLATVAQQKNDFVTGYMVQKGLQSLLHVLSSQLVV